jgi:hypothetical protein
MGGWKFAPGRNQAFSQLCPFVRQTGKGKTHAGCVGKVLLPNVWATIEPYAEARLQVLHPSCPSTTTGPGGTVIGDWPSPRQGKSYAQDCCRSIHGAFVCSFGSRPGAELGQRLLRIFLPQLETDSRPRQPSMDGKVHFKQRSFPTLTMSPK